MVGGDPLFIGAENCQSVNGGLQRGIDEMIDLRGNGALYYLDRICVPLKGDVRTLIMDEAHKSKYSVHPRADKMYYDDYEMWKLRIEQYFQVQDYALWDVIENANSFKPVPQVTTNADGTSTSTIPGAVTTEEKAHKKNDDAKTLFEATEAIFGSNEATKKTQKTLLKQMYKNFNASSTESLDSIFNWLQKIVSQLAILGENRSQEDLNLKFLRSLPAE
ncbi:hypothetical protein Tco_0571205 [Tanacetum coccineum]